MSTDRFDTLTKNLAERVPRRRALKGIAAGTAGALMVPVMAILGGDHAFADNGRPCPPGKQFPCGNSCCPNGSTCCIVNGSPFCCQPGLIGTTCPLTLDGLLMTGCLGV